MIKITQFTVAYLSSKMSVPIFGEIPSDLNTCAVVVSKAGGNRENYLPESTIRISCYADTMARAEDLSLDVQTAMDLMVELPEITCCEYGGDYNATEDKRYCFEVMYTITHY